MEDFKLNLQLFADGGAGAGAGSGGGDGATGATGQEAAAPVYELPASRRRPGMKKAAPATQPTQQPAPAAPTAAVQTEEKPAATADEKAPERKSFDELVKGEYKADFDARMQETIQKRLKSSKDAEARLAKYQDAMRIVGERYGVDGTDPEALTKALENDKSLYEDEAMREGVPVEQLMKQKRLEREVSQYRQQHEAAEKQRRDAEEWSSLIEQSKELRKTFPDFDLEAEIRRGDERSKRLANMVLKPPRGAGVPLQAAYIALNYDVVQQRVSQQMTQAVQQTAQATQQRAAQSIAAGARRPTENGTSGSAATTTKKQIPKTRAEFAEIKRRAANGEIISF